MLLHTSVLDGSKPSITITEQTLKRTSEWGLKSDVDAVPMEVGVFGQPEEGGQTEDILTIKTWLISLQMHDLTSPLLLPLLSPSCTCLLPQEATITSFTVIQESSKACFSQSEIMKRVGWFQFPV